MTPPRQKPRPSAPGDTLGEARRPGAPAVPTLAELRRELEQFELEAPDRCRFHTEMKDLREGLSERRLRERIGPLLVRVEKFATQFIRGPGDAELARSLFTPWISHLVGSAAQPEWRIVGGFDVLQRWCWSRYRAEEQALGAQPASRPEDGAASTPLG